MEQEEGEWGVTVSPAQFSLSCFFLLTLLICFSMVSLLHGVLPSRKNCSSVDFPKTILSFKNYPEAVGCKYSPSWSFTGSGKLPAPPWFCHTVTWRTSSPSFFSHFSAYMAALSSLFPPLLCLLAIFKCKFLNIFLEAPTYWLMGSAAYCGLSLWSWLETGWKQLCPTWDRLWPLLMEATPCVSLPTLGHLTPN